MRRKRILPKHEPSSVSDSLQSRTTGCEEHVSPGSPPDALNELENHTDGEEGNGEDLVCSIRIQAKFCGANRANEGCLRAINDWPRHVPEKASQRTSAKNQEKSTSRLQIAGK